MPDKPKMNRQIPSLPVLLERPTIPPVHIKLPISKPHKFGNNIKKEMKKTIKASNPHDSIGNSQPEPTLHNPNDSIIMSHECKPRIQSRLNVLNPQDQLKTSNEDELNHTFQDP